MFTLLPEKHKKVLLRKYRLRLLSVIMFFASALSVTGAVLLLPSYIALSIEDTRLEEETNNALNLITKKNNQGLSATLDDIKSMLASVDPDETYIYEALRIITTKRPAGISITSLDYSHDEHKSGSIKFKGVASSRAALLAFQKILQAEKLIETVDLPISNLAKDTDVKYSLTITGKF